MKNKSKTGASRKSDFYHIKKKERNPIFIKLPESVF